MYKAEDLMGRLSEAITAYDDMIEEYEQEEVGQDCEINGISSAVSDPDKYLFGVCRGYDRSIWQQKGI